MGEGEGSGEGRRDRRVRRRAGDWRRWETEILEGDIPKFHPLWRVGSNTSQEQLRPALETTAHLA